jgi:hypothetical protein
MSQLQRHRHRVGQLREGLNRLLALHRKVHDLHVESLALARARQPGHEEKVRALRQQAADLHDEIAMLREHLEDVGRAPRD